MLTDVAALDDVLFGPDGAAAALAPATVLVDMSTIGPEAVGAVREKLPAQVRFVDAPVQGSTPKARAGELVIFVGGAAEDVEQCRAVLDCLGTPRHVGPLGSGAAMKLVVNLILGASFVALGEALALADRLALDTDATLDALSGTAVGSLVPRVRARLADPGAPTQFAISLAAKDLRLVVEAAAVGEAAEDVVGDGVTAAAYRRLRDAVTAGHADADIAAIVPLSRR